MFLVLGAPFRLVKLFSEYEVGGNEGEDESTEAHSDESDEEDDGLYDR
jgi:hypothetical protein